MKSVKAYTYWKYNMNKHWVYANPNAGKYTDKIFDEKIIIFKNPQDAQIGYNADYQKSFLY